MEGATELIKLQVAVFGGEVLRKYEMQDGSVMHAEILIDDFVHMYGEASTEYPPNKF